MTANLYDDEHEEYRDKRMTIADCLDRFTDEGCPTECKPKQEWIPCSERLPEETGIYLCTVGDTYRNPREMRYAPQEWADEIANATWRDTDGYYVFDWFVEAWMPLPEPYKEK